MRLDKLMSELGLLSRTECKKAVKAGTVTVDGSIPKSSDIHVDPEKNEIAYLGKPIKYKKFTYIMLNKPEGYISATDDKRERTVLDLLGDREQKLGLFPCGRLDKNTLGLLILTNDGELCHRLLSPKHHVSKVYYFKSERLITDEDKLRIENGVNLDGELTLPAKLSLSDDRMGGHLTITEGKFHQVKRMLEAVCNKVTYLERVEFAGIPLDTKLERGGWRELTESEEAHLQTFMN